MNIRRLSKTSPEILISILFYFLFLGLTFWESYRPGKRGMEIFKEELPTWAFLTLLLIAFCYFKGECFGWRWGNKSKDN